jgi:hypothetical protein
MTPLTGRHITSAFRTAQPMTNNRPDRYIRPRNSDGERRRRLIADVLKHCERLVPCGARVATQLTNKETR